MAQGVAVAAGAVVDISKLDTTIQGTGAYTIPANRAALVTASVTISSQGWQGNSNADYNSSAVQGMTLPTNSGQGNDKIAVTSSSNANNGQFWLVAGDSITTSSNTVSALTNSNNNNTFLFSNYGAHDARFLVNGTPVLVSMAGGSSLRHHQQSQTFNAYVGVKGSALVGWNATLFIV